MITIAKARKCRTSSQRRNDKFVSILPTIREQASYAFRRVPVEAREELVQEVVAQAYGLFVRLAKSGQQRVVYPTPLAQFAIKKVRATNPTPGSVFEGLGPEADELPPAMIEEILGHKAQSQDGVVKVTIGRDGMMHGVKVGGSMGLTTWAAFSGGDAHAVVDGDFIMTAAEVQPVLRALPKSDIHIVALHNHMVGEQPAYYFTHFWGKGPAVELARGLRSALDSQKAVRPEGH